MMKLFQTAMAMAVTVLNKIAETFMSTIAPPQTALAYAGGPQGHNMTARNEVTDKKVLASRTVSTTVDDLMGRTTERSHDDGFYQGSKTNQTVCIQHRVASMGNIATTLDPDGQRAS